MSLFFPIASAVHQPLERKSFIGSVPPSLLSTTVGRAIFACFQASLTRVLIVQASYQESTAILVIK
jgi:hypothetical protein